MTEFRVLPVRAGEAYLLRSGRGAYLINGGPPGCAMPELLGERRLRKLRAAICTSVTAGRLGGLLELLRSDFNVGEFWLPEGLAVLPELARRFDGDMNGWLAATGRAGRGVPSDSSGWLPPLGEAGERVQGAATLLALAMAAIRGTWDHVLPPAAERDSGALFLYSIHQLSKQAADHWERSGKTSSLLWTTGCRLLEGGRHSDLGELCGRLMLAELERDKPAIPSELIAAIRVMILAAMVASLTGRSQADLRYFRPTGRMVADLVARHPMKCLNGVESAPLVGLAQEARPKSILNYAREMASRANGLVFQYGEARCGALFCGDTRMGFLPRGERLILDRPTIITAPGNGACSLDRAYAHIDSKTPSTDVWVRAFLPHSHKVAEAFRRQENKLCLNSRKDSLLREIMLRFEHGSWRHDTLFFS